MSNQREINISDIIEERKSEPKKRAEERRQKDLELIKSINRKNDDGIHPLNLFPKEMWDMISKNVKDHQSLENMWDTCTLFRELLEQRRTSEILFSKALETKRFYLHEFFNSDEEQEAEEDDDSYVKMEGKFWIDQRLICKTWRNVIDEHQAKMQVADRISLDDGRVSEFHNLFVLDVPTFISFKTFQDIYKPGAQKPVFLHKLEVSFPRSNNRILNALQNFGSQILIFELVDTIFKNVYIAGLTSPELYRIFVDWVTLMPNLQCLKVILRSVLLLGDPSMDEVIQSSPFPTLRKLKHLEIALVWGHDPIKILETILSKNVKLESLVIHDSIPEVEERLVQLIKSLKLTSFSFLMEYPNPEIEAVRLLNTSWCLKQIKLDIDSKSPSFSRMFRMLEEYPSLETVHLGIQWNRVMRDNYDRSGEENDFLRLPNLRNFKVILPNSYGRGSAVPDTRGLEYFCSVDYLLYCTNLETLFWCNYLREGPPRGTNLGREDEIIQFKAGWEDFTELNIWDVFPFLKTVKIQRWFRSDPRVYNRPSSEDMY